MSIRKIILIIIIIIKQKKKLTSNYFNKPWKSVFSSLAIFLNVVHKIHN